MRKLKPVSKKYAASNKCADLRHDSKPVQTPASTAPITPSVPAPATLDAKTKLVLTACAKQTRETIQTVKPSLSDVQAFALYVLCTFADSQTRDNVRLDLDTLQQDFNVRVSSDEVIRTL